MRSFSWPAIYPHLRLLKLFTCHHEVDLTELSTQFLFNHTEFFLSLCQESWASGAFSEAPFGFVVELKCYRAPGGTFAVLFPWNQSCVNKAVT